MKKNLVGWFTIIILLFLLSVNVNATDTASISLSASDTVNKGEEIDLKIVVKGTETGVQGVQGTLKYDTDMLEYVSNSSEKEGWKITAYNNNTGIFLAEITDVTNSDTFVHDESSIVSFKFRVKDTASEDETNINLSNIIAVGADSLESKQDTKTIQIRAASTGDTSNPGNDTGEDDGNNGNNGSGSNTGDSGNTGNSGNNGNTGNTGNNGNTGNSGNTGNNANTGNNGNSSNTGNNTATDKMPQTGKETTIYIVILINICISAFIYSCYKRYKEI